MKSGAVAKLELAASLRHRQLRFLAAVGWVAVAGCVNMDGKRAPAAQVVHVLLICFMPPDYLVSQTRLQRHDGDSRTTRKHLTLKCNLI